MELNLLSPAEAFYWANHITSRSGAKVAPRGMPTREVQNVTMHIQHPWLSPYLPERKARPAIGAVEALQLVGQVADPLAVERTSARMMEYADDGVFHGSYGGRAAGQLNRIARLLAADPATRQAVVTIHGGLVDLESGMRDVPCTLTLQFLWQQDRRLGLRVSMRSNDVWLGLPYDLFQFTALQCAMTDALKVVPGVYTHTVGSLHIYERDLALSEGLRGPSEPEAHERTYARRWGGKGWPDTSWRARALLQGLAPSGETAFEQELREALA